MAADPLPADEDLRGGCNIMLGFERVRFLPRPQVPVVDFEATALEQVNRLQTVRAGVSRHHHAMNGRSDLVCHFRLPCEQVGAHIASVPWYRVKPSSS